MACRTRHLRVEDLQPLLALLPVNDVPEFINLVEAALAQARWVYRRYKGGCSERRRREAAQLLVDLASLRPADEASAALAALSTAIFLAFNGEPLPPPGLLADLAGRACRELDPERVFKELSQGIVLNTRPRNSIEALKALASTSHLNQALKAKC